jgi:imidazolonepropionase-like amidohydrolase
MLDSPKTILGITAPLQQWPYITIRGGGYLMSSFGTILLVQSAISNKNERVAHRQISMPGKSFDSRLASTFVRNLKAAGIPVVSRAHTSNCGELAIEIGCGDIATAANIIEDTAQLLR